MGFAVVPDARRQIDPRSADRLGSDDEALGRDDEQSRVDRLDEGVGLQEGLRAFLGYRVVGTRID